MPETPPEPDAFETEKGISSLNLRAKTYQDPEGPRLFQAAPIATPTLGSVVAFKPRNP